MEICNEVIYDWPDHPRRQISVELSLLGSDGNIMKDILNLLTVKVAREFDIPLSRFFLDNTILQLDGEFAKALKVTVGRGRDSLSHHQVELRCVIYRSDNNAKADSALKHDSWRPRQ